MFSVSDRQETDALTAPGVCEPAVGDVGAVFRPPAGEWVHVCAVVFFGTMGADHRRKWKVPFKAGCYQDDGGRWDRISPLKQNKSRAPLNKNKLPSISGLRVEKHRTVFVFRDLLESDSSGLCVSSVGTEHVLVTFC